MKQLGQIDYNKMKQLGQMVRQMKQLGHIQLRYNKIQQIRQIYKIAVHVSDPDDLDQKHCKTE